MTNEAKERTIRWLTEEVRSLRLAPTVNGCKPDNWVEQLEVMETCLEVFSTITDLLARAEAAEAENAVLRKMQPVQLNESGSRALELAAEVSELKQKLAAAEERAEKAEAERDAAVSDMEALMWHSGDGCNVCANAIVVNREPYVRLDCSLKGQECNPKWRGAKEE